MNGKGSAGLLLPEYMDQIGSTIPKRDRWGCEHCGAGGGWYRTTVMHGGPYDGQQCGKLFWPEAFIAAEATRGGCRTIYHWYVLDDSREQCPAVHMNYRATVERPTSLQHTTRLRTDGSRWPEKK